MGVRLISYRMKDVPIVAPPVDELGPAMLKLTEQQRRFVVGWLGARGKNAARVARAAGFSSSSRADAVSAHRLLHNPKIIAALKEEAERQFDGIGALAIVALRDQIGSSDPKVRQAAIDSALDRTGYGRKSMQDIRVENVESRPTDELLTEIKELLERKKAPVIEGRAEVEDVLPAD